MDDEIRHRESGDRHAIANIAGQRTIAAGSRNRDDRPVASAEHAGDRLAKVAVPDQQKFHTAIKPQFHQTDNPELRDSTARPRRWTKMSGEKTSNVSGTHSPQVDDASMRAQMVL